MVEEEVEVEAAASSAPAGKEAAVPPVGPVLSLSLSLSAPVTTAGGGVK